MFGWLKRLRKRKRAERVETVFHRHLEVFTVAQRAVFAVQDINSQGYRDKYMSDEVSNATLFAHLNLACRDLSEEIADNSGRVLERCAQVANLAVMLAARNENQLDRAAKTLHGISTR